MNENKSSEILKSFGFQVEEKKEETPDKIIFLITKAGEHFPFKLSAIKKVSLYVVEVFDGQLISEIELPPIIDTKFMLFLVDYVNYVEKLGNVPVYQDKHIQWAHTLEIAVGEELYQLFVKHFNYKFMRSDLAVKTYFVQFGHFLRCSTALISQPLMQLFCIAHKIILQHLPSSEIKIKE